MPELTFTLAPRPPFRLDLTVWAIRRRAHNVVDQFDDGVWRRVLVIGRSPVTVAVTQTRRGSRPEIEVRISAARPRAVKAEVVALVTTMLGLERDLSDFYRLARGDAHLRELADRLRGMKPVRYATAFEAFANAVACQLVSLSAGMHVLNRLTEAFGVRGEIGGAAGLMRSFPAAGAIAHSNPEALRALGLSRQKGEYLIGLARMAIDPKDRDFASVERLGDDDAIARLSKIRGVGRWTAEYVMLRGLGRINIFPGDDVGGRNKLFEWLGADGEPTYNGVAAMLERWHPYGGLIYLHLIVNAVVDAGHIAAGI
ncbi:MAG TPA: AlkA N-terminal domain-containing protein [Candidatus Binatus sp.]|uniref:DNA-3-methyladenine glycosylase family protein n=1 Tax=Candidatus Binatus sp. TaxID=2811406 RepID=UPI002B48D409|nr:AlkA N-terminal domain-containing protein [Candidatus Binatus sp.]HKN14498.1 AlkA N-terminal domain-containing protein [Candidatus Binatus sp.]